MSRLLIVCPLLLLAAACGETGSVGSGTSPAPVTAHPNSNASSPTPSPVPIVPGTTMSHLVSSLQAAGFSCNQMSAPQPGWTSWDCNNTHGDQQATASPEGPDDQVSDIEADAVGVPSQTAAQYLTQITGLVFKGSASGQVASWVDAHIKSSDSQTTVGGVYLELVGNANGAPIWRLLINRNT